MSGGMPTDWLKWLKKSELKNNIMTIRGFKNLKNLENKRVLVRVDFNVPIKKGKVMDDSRLLASLPTIEYLIEKDAKVILVTHLGRPAGKVVASLKLDPIAVRFSTLLGKHVQKIDTGNWKMNDKKREALQKKIQQMRPGQVIMLDNVRFSPDEEKNSGTLAKELSELADIFVSDGFAVAHRASASVVGVAKYLPAYAGLLMEAEISGLEKIVKSYKKPFVGVVGGIKVATKAPLIQNILPKVDYLLVGGGLLNTCLHAKKYGVGGSVFDATCEKQALKCSKSKKIIMPIDVVVGTKDGKKFRLVSLGKKAHQVCGVNESIYDIGPETIGLFSKYIKKAQTLVWNGAVGYFEQPPYNIGTLSIARLIASRSKGKAFGVIGGGETIQAMEQVKMSEYVDLVSTGGGAMLEFLSGKKLPGIEILRK